MLGFALLLTLVAQEPIHYYNPAWSPDGRYVVFESNREGKDAIYRINADGSGLVRLTALDAASFQPSWSHDGKRIVFGSDRFGHGQLFVMNADGSAQRRLTNTESGEHFLPSFSPDGRWIVFANQFPQRNRNVYYVNVVRADGSSFRQLTDSTSSNEGPQWSRDGRHIVFTRVTLLQPNPGESPRDLMKRRAATAQKLQISPEGGPATPTAEKSSADSETKKSPDGRWEAYSKKVAGVGGLYIREIASGKERLLVGGPVKN